jgi:hypothetical protein
MEFSGSGILEWDGAGFVQWNLFETPLKVDKTTGFEEQE